MKKRSLLRTILCSILLFGTIVPSFAADQTAAVSPEVKETAKPKGSAYSRFADWLRARAKASKKDIRHLWRWGSKKARGQQVSERESAAVKRIAKKIGISLALIAGFMIKSVYDRNKYFAALKRIEAAPETYPGAPVISGHPIYNRIAAAAVSGNMDVLRDILYGLAVERSWEFRFYEHSGMSHGGRGPNFAQAQAYAMGNTMGPSLDEEKQKKMMLELLSYGNDWATEYLTDFPTIVSDILKALCGKSSSDTGWKQIYHKYLRPIPVAEE